MMTTMLLNDLSFDITWFIPEQCHYNLNFVATVLHCHVVMADISKGVRLCLPISLSPQLRCWGDTTSLLGRRDLIWGDATWGDKAMGRHNLHSF